MCVINGMCFETIKIASILLFIFIQSNNNLVNRCTRVMERISVSCFLLPKKEYIKTVGELLEATQAPKKSPHQFYLLKKYELLQCGDVHKIIRKNPNQEHPLKFATIEETFDIRMLLPCSSPCASSARKKKN